jgi:peptidoglycan/LPS O-acetylase OafA/YrhL
VAALLALAGSVLLVIRRRLGERARQAALACLLFAATAAVVVFGPDVFEFSWRYELPAVVVLIPAGAFGLSALWNWRRDRPPPADGQQQPADGQPAADAQG